MVTSPVETIKSCPCCNARFACTSAGCWCASLPPVMPLAPGGACYCPDCLAQLIAEKQQGTVTHCGISES